MSISGLLCNVNTKTLLPRVTLGLALKNILAGEGVVNSDQGGTG
jgi:hypothetical protein